MTSTQRRFFLQGIALTVGGTLAGCITEPVGSEDLDPQFKITSSVESVDGSWRLTVDLAVSRESLHDVTLLAYDESGAEVCRTDAGDFTVPGVPGSKEKTRTVTCEEFPAIITATATETPCDGARIEVQYWIGTDE